MRIKLEETDELSEYFKVVPDDLGNDLIKIEETKPHHLELIDDQFYVGLNIRIPVSFSSEGIGLVYDC